MGRTIQTGSMAAGDYEPSLGIQLLPRCANCQQPHPLARNPPADPATCPDCGASARSPGRKIEVPAEITGPFLLIAAVNTLLWIGRKLRRLAQRIAP